jgi:hypothetical protein
MYFIYFYENRAMKPVEITLCKGEGVRENEIVDGSNQGTL